MCEEIAIDHNQLWQNKASIAILVTEVFWACARQRLPCSRLIEMVRSERKNKKMKSFCGSTFILSNWCQTNSFCLYLCKSKWTAIFDSFHIYLHHICVCVCVSYFIFTYSQWLLHLSLYLWFVFFVCDKVSLSVQIPLAIVILMKRI